jgi:uncharacterized protein YdhG (YjbR/CyaY superfamily)
MPSSNASRSADIARCIAAAPPKAQPILRRIRATIQRAVPRAQATVGYRMPAFRLGRIFIYFAGFKKHIGIYPPVRGDKALEKVLQPYRGVRGNLKFPLDEPIPYRLIARVAKALARQYGD